MAEITTLESVAKLLPADRREQFYLTIQKYRTVPQDDDHLIMLDAMGFMALFMSKLPAEIGSLLDQAALLTDEQTNALGDQFGEILTSSLDVPNYKDMSELTRAIKDTYQKHHQESGRVLNRLGGLQREISKYSRVLPVISSAIITSLVTLIGGAVAAYFLLPKLLDKPITVPKGLWPYVELQKERRLKHIDSKLPEFSKGEVRILTIEDDVLGAFMDGDDAVVVLEKPKSEKSN